MTVFFNPFTGNLDFLPVGTGGGGTYPEVNTFADLPPANLHTGEIYVVLNATGQWYTLNRKDSGLYYSNGIIWEHLNDVPYYFSSTVFRIQDGIDNTKQLAFNTSGIPTATTVTLTVPAISGTIALTSDLTPYFKNGGNSFSGTAILGTNDNFDLQLRTNNSTTLTLKANKDINFEGQFLNFNNSGWNQISGSTVNGVPFRIYGNGGSGNISTILLGANTALTHTTGTGGLLGLKGSYFATNGNGSFSVIDFTNVTYQQSGTANGAIKGILYNPTITSLIGIHTAIETTAGNILFSGNPTLTIANGVNTLILNSAGTVTGTGNLTYNATGGSQIFSFGAGAVGYNFNLNTTGNAGTESFNIIGTTGASFGTQNKRALRFSGSWVNTVSGGTASFDGIEIIYTLNQNPSTGTPLPWSCININPTITNIKSSLYGIRSQLTALPTGGGLGYHLYLDGTAQCLFGGGIIETKFVTVSTSTYSLLTTDYQIILTIDSTFTLPLISIVGIGKMYKIFLQSVNLTLNPSGSDTLNGTTSGSASGYSTVVAKSIASGKWQIE